MKKTFAKPRGKAAKRLNELQRREEEAKGLVRDVQTKRDSAYEGLAKAERDVTDRYAKGQDPEAVTVELARAKDVAATPWQELIAGANLAAQRAAREVESHVSANFAELVAELASDSFAAAERLEGAIEAVFDAHEAWQAEARRFADLSRAVQGVSGADLPYLRFERVEGALTRLRGHVPPPLPRQLLVELDVGSKAEAIG